MATKKGACKVEIKIDQQGAELTFKSDEMHDLLDEKGAEYARRKTSRARKYLDDVPMPKDGLFSHYMKKGRRTWMAVIRPNNSVAYAIGRKYGTK